MEIVQVAMVVVAVVVLIVIVVAMVVERGQESECDAHWRTQCRCRMYIVKNARNTGHTSIHYYQHSKRKVWVGCWLSLAVTHLLEMCIKLFFQFLDRSSVGSYPLIDTECK